MLGPYSVHQISSVGKFRCCCRVSSGVEEGSKESAQEACPVLIKNAINRTMAEHCFLDFGFFISTYLVLCENLSVQLSSISFVNLKLTDLSGGEKLELPRHHL